jgi:Brp/Blh family beta-carotene 15,15'-monooxygenase
MERNWPTLDACFYYNVFYINLFFLAILIFFFHIKKDISFLDSLIILAEIVSTIAIFKYLPLIVAFTIYFCFMHSTKHILSSSMEINHKKLADGIKKFIKMSLPLTVITFAMAVIMLFYLNIDLTIEKSILRTIFIGLASLTLPHIMLEYIYGTYKKKF